MITVEFNPLRSVFRIVNSRQVFYSNFTPPQAVICYWLFGEELTAEFIRKTQLYQELTAYRRFALWQVV